MYAPLVSARIIVANNIHSVNNFFRQNDIFLEQHLSPKAAAFFTCRQFLIFHYRLPLCQASYACALFCLVILTLFHLLRL